MVNADDRGRGIGCMISRRLIWRTLDARRQPVGWLSRHLGRCAACSAYWRGARRLEAALRLPIPQEVVGPVVSAKICRGPRLVYRVAAAGALAACVAVLVMMLGYPVAERGDETFSAETVEVGMDSRAIASGEGERIALPLEDLALPLFAGSAMGEAVAAYMADLTAQSIEEEVIRLAGDTQWMGRSLMRRVPIDIVGMIEAID